MSLPIKQIDRLSAAGVAFEKPSVAVSVVVPIVERCDDLCELYRAHAAVLERLEHSFEFIFVLDDSFKAAGIKLEELMALGEPIRILTLSRNFGEATALTVGFEQARGDILLILSSYFQVVPEGVEQVLHMIDRGYDCVVARRFPRVDSRFNQLQTRGFHFFIRRFTGVAFHDISCGLKGLRKRVVQELHLYGDLHRFLPVLVYQRGFRVAEVDCPQHPADRWTRLLSAWCLLTAAIGYSDTRLSIQICKETSAVLRPYRSRALCGRLTAFAVPDLGADVGFDGLG